MAAFPSYTNKPFANDWLLISPVESVGDDAVMHKLPSPPKFNRDVELNNERKALTKWVIKKHSASQKTQEDYVLIYVQLHHQAAVIVGDIVVSVWWCCFEYCTSESRLYVTIMTNSISSCKTQWCCGGTLSYTKGKKGLCIIRKEGVEDIITGVPPSHNNINSRISA